MKRCFSTLGCWDRSLADILSLATQYGIDAVELRGIGGILDNREIPALSETHREPTLEALKKNGISISVLGTSCSFHRADRWDAALAEGLESIRIAERLHIPAIRVFGDRLLPDDKNGCMERVINGLRQLCRASDGVHILLEVHGDFNTVESLTPVINEMKEIPNFGLIWDIEHTHRPYGSDWPVFYRFARPYVKHVHVKDRSDAENRLTMIGEGDVPILPIVKTLLKDGYDGCFSLEWEKKWHPELSDIEEALEAFLALTRDIHHLTTSKEKQK